MILRSRATQLAVIVVATVAAGWPWITGRQLFAKRGTQFTLLAIDHLQRALSGKVAWRDAPLAWPLDDGITQLDWVGALAVLSWPLGALGVDPLHQHAALAAVAMIGSGVACAEVARALLGPGPHTWAAGVLAATNPSLQFDACYPNLLHHEPIVAGGLLLGAGLHARRPTMALLGGLLLGGSAQFGVYVGVHGWATLAVLVTAAAIARVGSRSAWAAGLLGAAIGVATMLPILAVYAAAKAKYGMELADPGTDLRAVPIDAWGWPLRGHPWHMPLARWFPALDASFNPGYIATLLIVPGAVLARRATGPRWAWGAILGVAIVSGLFALGPELTLHGAPTGVPGPLALVTWLPGGDALRGAFRWLLLTWLATAVLGAVAAQWLLARGRWGQAAVAALLIGVIAEARPPEGLAPAVSQRVAPVYHTLAQLDAPGALYDVRAGRGDGSARIRAAFVHHRARVGGTYARTSPVHQAIDRLANRWPSPAADVFFRRAGVGVVLSSDPIPDAPADARCQRTQGHTLCVLPLAPPLPATDAVTVTPHDGPIVGFRIPSPRPPPQVGHPPSSGPPGPPLAGRPGPAPDAPKRVPPPPPTGPDGRGATARLTCGPHVETALLDAWRVLTLARDGWVDHADVYFEQPCAADAHIDAPGAVALYPTSDATWPRR